MTGISATDERGVALVWISILLLIGGVFIAGVLALARPMNFEKQEEITYRHTDQIIHALSVYVQKYGRIPCPANPDRAVTTEPYGTERGSGAGGDAYGSCTTSANMIGIIPFRTLGLSEREARDGWRNFITYRMAGPLAGAKVHKLCLTYTTPGHGGPLPKDWVDPPAHKNPPKAYFCCGEIDNTFDVIDAAGNSVAYLSGIPGPPWGAGGNPYGPITSTAPSHTVAGLTLPDKLAVVLVSHGGNGHGAFLDNGTQASVINPAASEAENADLDGRFLDLPRTLADLIYFDDIITWRTQSHLLSETTSGNDNAVDCSSPFP